MLHLILFKDTVLEKILQDHYLPGMCKHSYSHTEFLHDTRRHELYRVPQKSCPSGTLGYELIWK